MAAISTIALTAAALGSLAMGAETQRQARSDQDESKKRQGIELERQKKEADLLKKDKESKDAMAAKIAKDSAGAAGKAGRSGTLLGVLGQTGGDPKTGMKTLLGE
jgi:hypothetical protein